MKKTTLALACAALVSACSGGGTGGDSKQDPGEPNDSIASALQIQLGTPVIAAVGGAADRDFYKFTLEEQATVRIQTFDGGGVGCDAGSNLVDTRVAVYDPVQTPAVDSDDSGVNLCEDVAVTLPAGTSYLEIAGYPPFPLVYTVLVTAVPGNPDPGEPNDAFATATQVSLGTPSAGTVLNAADRDYFAFTLDAPAMVKIQTFDDGGADCAASVDTRVDVYGPSLALVTTSDDSGVGYCEHLTVALPAGTNYVAVGGYPPVPFAYTLVVEQL